MLDRHRRHAKAAGVRRPAPTDLADVAERQVIDEVARARGADDCCARESAGQLVQARAVEVVEVGVAQQDQVNPGQAVDGQRRLLKASGGRA